MPIEAGTLTERITIQRLNDAPLVKAWEDIANPDMSAAVEALGDESHRIRIRYRADLFGFQDTEPALRVLWKDRVLIVRDVIETQRREEVALIATSRQIPTDTLELGESRRFP